jgi:ABC-type transport system involved in cytochrome c biogenesis permease subunit
MKKWIPLLVTALVALWPIYVLIPKHDSADRFAYHAFGSLPVLTNGRIQPLDSLARNSMLQLHDKQSLATTPWDSHSEYLTPVQWLMEMFMNPDLANTRPVFRIDHPQLKGLLGLPMDADPEKKSDGKNYSFDQFKEKLEPLQRESMRVQKKDASQRDSFDQAVNRLVNGVGIYMKLQNTLQPQNAHDWEKEFHTYQANIPAAMTAARAQQAKQSFDQAALDRVTNDLERIDAMSRLDPPLLIPPVQPGDEGTQGWMRTSEALIAIARGQPVSFAVESYAKMAGAYRGNRITEFNQLVADYRNALAETHPASLRKAGEEQYFNAFEPFYLAMVIYVLAGVLALGYWMDPKFLDVLRRTAVSLVILGLVIHTAGLIFRMTLEGRPPVTNLYSSAVFIGFGAVILGLVIEAFWKNSIGVMVSCVIGFLTLIIAHHLALEGDTMEMMRAVLDTNFWLATHVVVVTLGYASTFVAGIIAVIGILIAVVTRSYGAATGKPRVIDAALLKPLAKMVYGIVCFATLFSFVGTVLGGIWADQSWGRFWGWDPKENGALIIVLWNALVLHARWGGMVRDRGMLNLAIVGNIVTSWSWFGVNMLGIGLHSYGFTNAAFNWLRLFVGSQLLLIAIGSIPQLWRLETSEKPAGPDAPGASPAAA